MHLSPHLQLGLKDLVLASVFGLWLAASLKMRKVYLGRLGWLTWMASPQMFWAACAALAAITAMFTWFLIRLIIQG